MDIWYGFFFIHFTFDIIFSILFSFDFILALRNLLQKVNFRDADIYIGFPLQVFSAQICFKNFPRTRFFYKSPLILICAYFYYCNKDSIKELTFQF